MTMTAQEVMDRVKRQFGDESGVQITDTDILRWINDGQREIVSKNAILQARATADIQPGVGEYTLPIDKVLHVVALKVNGQRLPNLSYQEAQEQLTENDPNLTATGTPEVWTSWAGSFRIYPTPTSFSAAGLVLDYVKIPDVVQQASDELSVPDRYFNTLVHYVLAQAYEQDEDWTAAGNKIAQLEANLNSLLEEENRPQHEYYPFITMTEDY